MKKCFVIEKVENGFILNEPDERKSVYQNGQRRELDIRILNHITGMLDEFDEAGGCTVQIETMPLWHHPSEEQMQRFGDLLGTGGDHDKGPEDDPPDEGGMMAGQVSKRKPNRRGSKRRKVEVKDGDKWLVFNTTKEAASFIGCGQPQVCTAISRGQKCHGYEVRYHEPELDAVLKEIEERNRQPYEPAKPVR